MTATVNIHDAKTHLSKLIERALAGEDIIVAKAGKPCVRLVAIKPEPKPSRTPGGLKISGDIPDSVWFDPFYTEEELDSFERVDWPSDERA